MPLRADRPALGVLATGHHGVPSSKANGGSTEDAGAWAVVPQALERRLRQPELGEVLADAAAERLLRLRGLRRTAVVDPDGPVRGCVKVHLQAARRAGPA